MDTRSRKRGIRASRSKLETAMLAADFNTQLDIAKQIALDEGLSKTPKDLVNRVFRQENVAPHTIARIARALRVEPYTLYLSMSEDKQLQSMAVTPTAESSKISAKYFYFVIVAIAFLSWLGFQAIYQSNKHTSQIVKPVNPETLNRALLGQYSIAIVTSSAQLNDFANELKQDLSSNFNTIVVDRVLHPDLLMSVDIAKQYGTDAVITLRQIKGDEYLGVQAYLYFQQLEKLIWVGSLSIEEIINHKQFMINRLSPYVSVAMGIKLELSSPLPSFESIASQEKYLKARKLLSTDLTELNYKAAKEYLRAAIDLSPNFARAYAALCENTVFNSWRGDEKANLEEAQIACDRAMELASDDFYVVSAMAYLLRRTGRVSESIERYKDVLEQWPSHVKATSGISSAYLDAFRQDLEEFPKAIQQAIKYGEQATLLQPDNWMHHMQLGIMYYYGGDILQAIDSYQLSATLHPTAGAYASIGTMSLCRGKIEEAIVAFTRSQQLDPSSYVGDEFLGTGHYYLGNFEKSAMLRQKALDAIEDSGSGAIHQMWGQMGDSYRQSGKIDNAVSAYLKAISMVDKDIIRNNDAVEDHVYRKHYYLYLSQLAPKKYPASLLNDEKFPLDEYLGKKMSSGAFLKLSIIFSLQKNHKMAKQALDKATAICPGYLKYPDIIDLLTQT